MLKNLFKTCCIFFFCYNVYADPWFTGPIIAQSGQATPLGQANLEIFGYYMSSNANYTEHWNITQTPTFQSNQLLPQFTYGITDKIDVQLSLLYMKNQTLGRSSRGLGDTSLMLGFQLLEQKQSLSRPDIRLTIQEVFPTGRFEELRPANLNTDALGSGSYQTSVGLNFQHLSLFGKTHFFNTHFNIVYVYAAPASIDGLSSYGGSSSTHGHITPGNLLSLDLAAELSLTQNWVAVLEGYFAYQEASKFQGVAGEEFHLPRLSNIVQNMRGLGHGCVDQFTLAPAIEYNFSENYGIIAGVWFTLAGKNTPKFTAPVVALNISW